MADINQQYSKKFASQLGNSNDFVDYVALMESRKTLSSLVDFKGTNGTRLGKRYLLVKKGGVIDFRHFFAAMMQVLEGGTGKPFGIGSTSEGTTLLLGVLNEVNQCVDEATRLKLNSCFSREDLFSNRAGARFGETIVIKRAEASRQSVASLLRLHLDSYLPLPAAEIQKLQMPSAGNIALESVGAVLKALSDALIPSAY